MEDQLTSYPVHQVLCRLTQLLLNLQNFLVSCLLDTLVSCLLRRQELCLNSLDLQNLLEWHLLQNYRTDSKCENQYLLGQLYWNLMIIAYCFGSNYCFAILAF